MLDAHRSPWLARYEGLISGLLGIGLLLLPITSLPVLSRAMGKTLVAPPSIVFVCLAGALWLPLAFLRRRSLPRETLPFIIFGMAALISSLLAAFNVMPAFRNFSLASAETSALITLAIGAVSYLIFAAWFQHGKRLGWALKLISLGGAVILAWSFVQLFYMKFEAANYPGVMVKFQGLLSLRSLTSHSFYNRLSGLAYEPSWLAHQLNVLYLPLWLAASITGYSAFRRLGRLTVENVLLVGGLIIFFFSQSRIGLLALVLGLAYLVYLLNLRLIEWLQARYKLERISSGLFRVVGVVLLFAAYFVFVSGLVLLLARLDHRFATLLSLSSIPTSLLDFADQADFAQRVIYWLNGWLVFARFPAFGVGLGNAGFFLRENLPVLGERMVEITRVLYSANNLPNVKSLWARILAETGLVGSSIFVSWLYLLWHAGKFMKTSVSAQLRALGWMAALVILVFLAEGFSVDSFAMPYLWVSLGLVTAGSAMARHEHLSSLRNDSVEPSEPS